MQLHYHYHKLLQNCYQRMMETPRFMVLNIQVGWDFMLCCSWYLGLYWLHLWSQAVQGQIWSFIDTYIYTYVHTHTHTHTRSLDPSVYHKDSRIQYKSQTHSHTNLQCQYYEHFTKKHYKLSLHIKNSSTDCVCRNFLKAALYFAYHSWGLSE
jgi:hypothetical protein